MGSQVLVLVQLQSQMSRKNALKVSRTLFPTEMVESHAQQPWERL